MFLKRVLKFFDLTLPGLLSIVLGSLIMSFTLVNIHLQANVTEGGVLGMTVLLFKVFHLNPSIVSPILDISCLLIGTKLLGKLFFKRSILTALVFAGCYGICLWIGPLLPDFYHQPLLACILGGLGIGIGCGMVISQGGAAGGDDALALIISNKLSIKISWAYLFTDITVLLLSLSYIPLDTILYSLLTTSISSVLVGQFEVNMNPINQNEMEKV